IPCATTLPSRVGTFSGIQRPVSAPGSTGASCSASISPASGFTAPSKSYDGTPPLLFHTGGTVMGPTAAITLTPIYWAPAGFTYPSNYQSLTGQYLTDITHDSGLNSNVFSVMTQYTDGASTHIAYNMSLGSAITDTAAYPSSGGCTPDTGEVYTD